MNEVKNTCCFFGHRKISGAESLKIKVYETMENLILGSKVDTFLMGSKSEFDSLCRDVVKELKQKYPYIKRIYVRAEYPNISDDYERYLLKSCEKTYFPDHIIKAGKLVYVERNFEMIDKSKFCLVYFDESYAPVTKIKTKSGTKLAYDYAVKKGKCIINIFNQTK